MAKDLRLALQLAAAGGGGTGSAAGLPLGQTAAQLYQQVGPPAAGLRWLVACMMGLNLQPVTTQSYVRIWCICTCTSACQPRVDLCTRASLIMLFKQVATPAVYSVCKLCPG
jgi:hypothetical protein